MERYLPKSVKISDKSCYVDKASNIAKHNKKQGIVHCLKVKVKDLICAVDFIVTAAA